MALTHVCVCVCVCACARIRACSYPGTCGSPKSICQRVRFPAAVHSSRRFGSGHVIQSNVTDMFFIIM